MTDAADNKSWHRYRDAMTASTKLTQQDDNEEALRLLDDSIAMAISENENQWVLTLSHHPAVISNFLGNLSRVKLNRRLASLLINLQIEQSRYLSLMEQSLR